ncbi:MAG: hypothetical protein LQ340_003408 [Diploschistes diacapsis]|nr:MAG: hypothetical protein LQ340_003408 [Diploschistes diacapsis]
MLAVVPNVGGNHEAAAAYFCWQHKDQASNLAMQPGASQILELKERSSIDTLVNRLGVLEVEDKPKRRRNRPSGDSGTGADNTVRRDTLPQQWQGIPGPLMAVPENPLDTQPTQPGRRPPARPSQKQQRDVHFSFFCCMRRPPSETLPAPRPRPALQPEMASANPHHTPSNRPSLSTLPQAGVPVTPTPSQTSRYLSLIPSTVQPATASILLSELTKPFTPSDHEPGYIYIFWLTPTNVPRTAASAASSLLAPPSRPDGVCNARRTSDVLRDFAATSSNESDRAAATTDGRTARGTAKEKTITLKIGRASNVHRRMNEWSRQCGHHITLLRYYPAPNHNPASLSTSLAPSPTPSPRHFAPARPAHLSPTPSDGLIPSSPSPSPSSRKAPFIQRVERLIHLELQEKRVKRACDGCGKEHREWFEVDASREGVRDVDACVRRWVGWATHEKEI